MMIASLLMTASLLSGAQDTALAPPSGPHRLAYTHTDSNQVAFIDLAALQRTGDVVETWGLTVLSRPLTPFGSPPAEVFWTRIRIDCAARVGRFTHAIAIVDGAVAFNQPVAMRDTPAEGSWALDEAYACRNETPTRPVEEDSAAAIAAARALMAGEASAAGD
ncbi:hypothetical protein [Brevundimonas sp.]